MSAHVALVAEHDVNTVEGEFKLDERIRCVFDIRTYNSQSDTHEFIVLVVTRLNRGLQNPVKVGYILTEDGFVRRAEVLLFDSHLGTVLLQKPQVPAASWLSGWAMWRPSRVQGGAIKETPLIEFIESKLIEKSGSWLESCVRREVSEAFEGAFTEMGRKLQGAALPSSRWAEIISAVMLKALSVRNVSRLLTAALVNSEALSDLIFYLRSVRDSESILSWVLERPCQAKQIWQRTRLSDRRLVVLMLCSARCNSIRQADPKKLLRQTGIGSKAASRLRHLDDWALHTLCEAAFAGDDGQLAMEFFKRLPVLLPWMHTLAGQPLPVQEDCFAVTCRLLNRAAILNRFAADGWKAIPRAGVEKLKVNASTALGKGVWNWGAAVSPKPGVGVDIAALLAIFRSALTELTKATEDVWDLAASVDHLLDWFTFAGDVDGRQIERCSFGRLTRLANARSPWWLLSEVIDGAHESGWDCALGRGGHSFARNVLDSKNVSERLAISALDSGRLLIMESETMNHCVCSYWKSCVSGDFRFFSVNRGGRRFATLQLRFDAEVEDGRGAWKAVQLKGRSNRSLEHMLFDMPYAVVFADFVRMYNQWQARRFQAQ